MSFYDLMIAVKSGNEKQVEEILDLGFKILLLWFLCIGLLFGDIVKSLNCYWMREQILIKRMIDVEEQNH